MRTGFIGTGRMGSGMAGRILHGGFDLTILHRRPGQAHPLQQEGAVVTDSIAAVSGNSDVIITMLPSDEALEDVVYSSGGLLESMQKDTVHMAMGTHGIAMTRRLMASHSKAGQIFVVSAVLGRPDLAAAGKLSIIPAGPVPTLQKLRPLLETMGSQIFDAGDDPQSATALKVAHNFVLGCAIEVMGEGFALVRKFGIEPALFLDVLTKGLFSAPAYQVYGRIIAEQAYDEVGASVKIGLKDANLALAAAEIAGMPLPSANVFRDRLLGAIAHGEGDLDWAVVARDQARASGLE